MVLVALALPMFFAMVALVVDGSRAFVETRAVQNAADSAALAAARDLKPALDPSCDSACLDAVRASVVATAESYSGQNGVTTSLVPCMQPSQSNCYTWPYNGSNAKVEVRLRKTIDALFGPVVGLAGGFFRPAARAVAGAAGITQPQCVIDGVQRNDLLPDCRIAGEITTEGGGGSFDGAYIYADGDISLTGSAAVQQPVLAGHDLILKAKVMSIARLVAVGLKDPSGAIVESAGGYIGNGPRTTLTADLAQGATTALANASGYPYKPGTIQIDDEWILFGNNNATSFSTLTRGYGGYNASPAVQHAGGTAVEGRVTDLYAPGGCGATPCTSASWVFAKNIYGTVYAFTKPTHDVNDAYAKAAPGPSHPCDPATKVGSPPRFDNDTTLNGNLTPSGDLSSPVDLTPGASYRCTATAPDGSTGEIAWDNSTSGATPKTLTVHGTIFFDGNIAFSQSARYTTGSSGATIYTSRNIDTFTAGDSLCATGTFSGGTWFCDFAHWDPNANLLGLVAHTFGGSTYSNCMAFMGAASGSGYQGAFYMDGYAGPRTKCENGSAEALRVAAAGATIQGLFIVGGDALWSAGSSNPSPSITDLPGDFPGSSETHCYIDGVQRDDLLADGCVLQGETTQQVVDANLSMDE
jgi:hypothetical protein